MSDMEKEFEISVSMGFLPEVPPLERLPDEFITWEKLMDMLTELISKSQLRKEVDNNFPLLTVSNQSLPTERHWMRAYCVLTFLSQGYLWQNGEEGVPAKLPKQLAVPWWEVSQRLGLPPIATYAGVVLWNWRVRDPSAPIALENIEMLNNYTGTRDEEWFYYISLAVELSAVKGIVEARNCLKGMQSGDISKVINCLESVTACIAQMKVTSNRMYEECKPDVFYGKIRHFQAGSKNMKAFGEGLIFEGVDDEPKVFNGASAAESSTLPVFDILLGVEHSGEAKRFLDQQKWHMPRAHRQFLLALSLQPSLRTFVLQNKSNKELTGAYNKCVTELGEFRNNHIVLVTRYIIVPSSSNTKKPVESVTTHDTRQPDLATRGTGGSDFMVFLKSVRDDTLKCIIQT